MHIKKSIQNLYNRVLSSSFLKSVLTLSSGVVVAQGIAFIGMPIVGRIYTPATMGDYTIITANAGVISSVACLGMMTAFMLPEKDEEAQGLLRLVTYSTLLITTLAVLGLWFASGLYRIFHTEETPYLISLLVLWLFIVFNTINGICYAYVNRCGLYRVMFWNPVIGTGISVGLSIIFGLLNWEFIGYTVAHIAALVISIIHLICFANPYKRGGNSEYKCLPLLKSYRRFPLYQMPANLINSFGVQIPVQILEALYSSSVLGMYSMANKILSLPSSLLATPINRVYFREASERYNRGEDIGEFSFRILQTNIKLAIIPISVLVIFGEWIFSVFLGEQWQQAGMFASVLGIYYLMQFCGGCLSGNYTIIGKNHWNLYSALANLILNIFTYILAVNVEGLSVIAFLTIQSALMTCTVFAVEMIFFIHTGVKVRKYLMFIFKCVFLPFSAAYFARFLIRNLII